MNVCAIVLAAGSSRRFGMNKLLLPFGDQSVIQSTLATVVAAEITHIKVVTGHDATLIEQEVTQFCDARVTLVRNADHDAGEMLSSIKVGLRALEGTDALAALVVLGDQPLLQGSVLRSLLARHKQHPGEIIAPVYRNQRGHPVLFPRRFWAELLELPPDGNPRDVIRKHGGDLQLLEAPDDTILLDVDTADAYAHVKLRAGLT